MMGVLQQFIMMIGVRSICVTVFWFSMVVPSLLANANDQKTSTIRIVEGVDINGNHNSYGGYEEETSQITWGDARLPPKPAGPPFLLPINGECFSSNSHGYEYEVCPFQNATRKYSSYGAKEVLGIWVGWRNGTQQFHHGAPCFPGSLPPGGGGDGHHFSATMLVTCGAADFGLRVDAAGSEAAWEGQGGSAVAADEYRSSFPYVCHHKFELSVPLPCGVLGDLGAHEGVAPLAQLRPPPPPPDEGAEQQENNSNEDFGRQSLEHEHYWQREEPENSCSCEDLSTCLNALDAAKLEPNVEPKEELLDQSTLKVHCHELETMVQQLNHKIQTLEEKLLKADEQLGMMMIQQNKGEEENWKIPQHQHEGEGGGMVEAESGGGGYNQRASL